MKKATRRKAIRVWVNEEEKTVIESRREAVNCGSTSSYLRALGLGYEPTSKLDKLAVLELAKVNADQGRLGGLLKMLLTNEERHASKDHQRMLNLLREIETTQQHLLTLVEQL